MMPGIMNQLGPDSMKDLKRMMGSVRAPPAARLGSSAVLLPSLKVSQTTVKLVTG
jgi:hypothetical protein